MVDGIIAHSTDPATRTALIEAARAARKNAHAPFSGYRVGAAVLAQSGVIYSGCNVEISSYSHTCCAERVAVFSAISAGERVLLAAAVITGDAVPITPCGACRQVLHDFGPDMTVILATESGPSRDVALKVLLPDAFHPDSVLPYIRKAFTPS